MNLEKLQEMGERSAPRPRGDYTGELLALSGAAMRLEDRLKQMRKHSTGAIQETRERVQVGKALRAIKRAAKELQS